MSLIIAAYKNSNLHFSALQSRLLMIAAYKNSNLNHFLSHGAIVVGVLRRSTAPFQGSFNFGLSKTAFDYWVFTSAFACGAQTNCVYIDTPFNKQACMQTKHTRTHTNSGSLKN